MGKSYHDDHPQASREHNPYVPQTTQWHVYEHLRSSGGISLEEIMGIVPRGKTLGNARTHIGNIKSHIRNSQVTVTQSSDGRYYLIPQKPTEGSTEGDDVSESNNLNDLRDRLQKFAADRDWDQFHSPKNLAMALTGEVGELVEHFQWLTEEQSKNLSEETKAEIALELADIFVYLIRLSDKLDIDLVDAAKTKLEINEKKYPSDKVRGSAKKYNQY